MLSSVKGTVFLVNDKQELLGAYKMDHCKDGGSCDSIKKIPCVYEDEFPDNYFSLNLDIQQQVALIMAKNIYNGILPVVDKNRVIKGGIICTDQTWDNDIINSVTYLNYLKEKKYDIGYYFREKHYTRVAFWGIDKQALAFSNILLQCEGVEVIGIYENTKLKKYCKVDYLNSDANIIFVDSIKSVFEAGDIDLLLISDWTMRHLDESLYVRKSKVDAIYINKLLKGQEFMRYMNSYMAQKWKGELADKGCEFLTVRIPTEKDLSIKITKQDHMTLEERIEWLARQNGWKTDSEEVKEFNEERHSLAKRIKKQRGKIYFADFNGKYINYVNKSRLVINIPKNYKNTIYLVGSCIVSSLFSRDEDSLGYYLQELFNQKSFPYRVIALGLPNEADRYYFCNILEDYDIKNGDKVFMLDQTFRGVYWDLDVLPAFQKLLAKYGTDFYYDLPVHCGREGMKAVSQLLFDYVQSHRGFIGGKPEVRKKDDSTHDKKNMYAGDPKLKAYKNLILSEAIHEKQRIGAIVMNCNPFTLGHQYLIEYAASQVSYLYVFVVEEDKSYFKFEDRIELVKKGTSHLKNVKCLPSGEFIISSQTFSEYFDKANLQGTVIDTSLDVEIFAEEIAPTLDITVRFVGEEPLDPVTAQYNQSMKEILPKYGLEVREVPRKACGGNVISASRVRECLKEKKWEEIKELVPQTTYEFLCQHF